MIPAERVYGDAVCKPKTRNAATLARWIVKVRATEVHVRHLQREVRLPGLTDASSIHEAAQELVDSDWLYAPGESMKQGRPRAAYKVNPILWATLP